MEGKMTEDDDQHIINTITQIPDVSLYASGPLTSHIAVDKYSNHRSSNPLNNMFNMDTQHMNPSSQLHYMPASFIDEDNHTGLVSSSSSSDFYDSLAAGFPFLAMNDVDQQQQPNASLHHHSHAFSRPMVLSLPRLAVDNNDFNQAAMFFLECKNGDIQEAVKYLRNVIFALYTTTPAPTSMHPAAHMAPNSDMNMYQPEYMQIPQPIQQTPPTSSPINYPSNNKSAPFGESNITPNSIPHFSDKSDTPVTSNYGATKATDIPNGMGLNKRTYTGIEKQNEFNVNDYKPNHQKSTEAVIGTSPNHMQDSLESFDDQLQQQQFLSSSSALMHQLPPPTLTIQEISMFGDEIDLRPSTLIMLVPGKPHIIGHLIGKGGVEIGKIEAETGVIVKIETQDKMPVGSMERRISIIGTIKSNVIAQQYISIKIQEKLLQEGIQQEILRLVVPNETVRHLIGKSGANINKLQNESGARIQVEAESSMIPGSIGRTIVLQGNQACRTRAQYLIARQMSEDRNLPPDWAGVNRPVVQGDSQPSGNGAGNGNNGPTSGAHTKHTGDHTGFSATASNPVVHQSQRHGNHQNQLTSTAGAYQGSSRLHNGPRSGKPNTGVKPKNSGPPSMFQKATESQSENTSPTESSKYPKKKMNPNMVNQQGSSFPKKQSS